MIRTDESFGESFESKFLPKNVEERFCYIIGRDKNNSTYNCRACGKRICGGPQKIRVHISGIMEGSTQVARCPNPDPVAVELFRDIREKMDGKRKRDYESAVRTANPNTPVDQRLRQVKADAAIFAFLRSQNLCPEVLTHPSFTEMAKSLSIVGPTYVLPKTAAFEARSDISIVQNVIEDDHRQRPFPLAEMAASGSSLCVYTSYPSSSDVPIVNLTLSTTKGLYYVPSASAQKWNEDSFNLLSADILYTDIAAAITTHIGQDSIFLVCIPQEYCNGSLLLPNGETSDLRQRIETTFQQLFTQPCAKDGCMSVLRDIRQLFQWELSLCLRLIKIICTHDCVMESFTSYVHIYRTNRQLSAANPADAAEYLPSLCQPVNAANSSLYLCVECVVTDKDYIRCWFKNVLHQLDQGSFLTGDSAPAVDIMAAIQEELVWLSSQFVDKQSTWNKLDVYVACEKPSRLLCGMFGGCLSDSGRTLGQTAVSALAYLMSPVSLMSKAESSVVTPGQVSDKNEEDSEAVPVAVPTLHRLAYAYDVVRSTTVRTAENMHQHAVAQAAAQLLMNTTADTDTTAPNDEEIPSYASLADKLLDIFLKHNPACVSSLALAAASVNPYFLYSGSKVDFNPPGGQEALFTVIDKYFMGSNQHGDKAKQQHKLFRSQNGPYFGSVTAQTLGQVESGVEAFWQAASIAAPELALVARRLCCGFGGCTVDRKQANDVNFNRQYPPNGNGVLENKNSLPLEYADIKLNIDQTKGISENFRRPFLSVARDRILHLSRSTEAHWMSHGSAEVVGTEVAGFDLTEDVDPLLSSSYVGDNEVQSPSKKQRVEQSNTTEATSTAGAGNAVVTHVESLSEGVILKLFGYEKWVVNALL